MKKVSIIFSDNNQSKSNPHDGVIVANLPIQKWEKYVSLFATIFLLALALGSCSSSGGRLSSSSQAYYIDATLGDDNNKGNSPKEAWKSLSKIQSVKLKAGDEILLKKGETFHGELFIEGVGTKEAPILIDAYGDKGNNPCIVGHDTSSYAVCIYNSEF